MTLKLMTNAIKILQLLTTSQFNRNAFAEDLGITKQQVKNLLKYLQNHDYIEINHEDVKLKQNAKVILLKNIMKKYDLVTMLHDSNEKVLYALTEPMSKTELEKYVDLSDSTIYRSLSELESIGAISRDENLIQINNNDKDLVLFANLLKRDSMIPTENYVDIIYRDNLRIIKKIPKGYFTEGELTAFSLFTEYGLEYQTAYDYYVQQSTPLQLEEILIHSIVIAIGDIDKNALIMAILFYLKNRNKMDILNLRSLARSYKTLSVWLDVEGYLRNGTVKNQHLFPNKEEFSEKADLYNIEKHLLELPQAYPKLFEELGTKVKENISAYLIGGENMRIKKLKDRTKDCDIVVENHKQYVLLQRALEDMGYVTIESQNMSPEDHRINAMKIMTHPSRSRLDIFIKNIGRKLHLSKRMTYRAEFKKFGNLRLGILANEDVFLLKSVTDREGDVHDMAKIIQQGNFNWRTVWDELVYQESETKNSLLFEFFLEQIDDLYENIGVRPPFYKRLVRKVIDSKIHRLISNGGKPLKDIIYLLMSHDITERMIRNRINYLEIKQSLRKKIENEKVILMPRDPNISNIQTNTISFENTLQDYLQSIGLKLELPDDVMTKVKETGRRISKNTPYISHRPKNLAAAIIFNTMRKSEYPISWDKLSLVSGISKSRLNILSKKLEKEQDLINEPANKAS